MVKAAAIITYNFIVIGTLKTCICMQILLMSFWGAFVVDYNVS